MTTPVTVTKPIRGSLSSGSASDSTCRIDSFTRRIRSVIGIHDLPVHADELPLLAAEIALGAVQELLELAVAARDARDREPGALPEVVVVDLGDRGAEAVLELRLGGLDVLALALQRRRPRGSAARPRGCRRSPSSSRLFNRRDGLRGIDEGATKSRSCARKSRRVRPEPVSSTSRVVGEAPPSSGWGCAETARRRSRSRTARLGRGRRADSSSAVRSTWRTSYASMTSPSLTSSKPSRWMPHSKPSVTSRTSSLKRFSESIVVS